MPLICVLLFIITSALWAQNNHIAIMGGGGEPKGSKTIFDHDVRNIGEFARTATSWEVKLSFNGGHSTTEEILKNGVEKRGVTNGPFTNQSFETIIADYEKQLKDNRLKEGDKILLYINSHGGEKSDNDISHGIVTGGEVKNLQDLSGASSVKLDRLQSLIKLAEGKKIKLAVLDFSCHSGNTLAMAGPNTCIISSTGPNHFAYGGGNYNFGARFADLMAPGKNLEEIFLEAFSDRYDIGFPMLSTPRGKEVQQDLYSLITPYLYKWHPESDRDKLSPLIEKQVLEGQCLNAQSQLEGIYDWSKQIEEIVKVEETKKIDLSKFRQAVKEYYDYQTKIRHDLIDMQLPLLKSTERFCAKSPAKVGKSIVPYERCLNWTVDRLMSTDFEAYQKLLDEQKQTATNTIDKALATAEIAALAKAKVRTDKLLDQHPGLEKYKDYYKNLPELQEKTTDLAYNVSNELRLIYKDLYQSGPKNNSPNPCRDFVL